MYKTSLVIAGQTVDFEVNSFARQSDGSVLIKSGGTVLLVTANASPNPREGQDFMPLTVDYLERIHAAGRIPGSYFRREGRPTEREVLTSRLMDRPLRPLIGEGFYFDTQVIATVFSADNIHNPDVLAVTGASFALCASSIPFNGPIACVRVAKIGGVLKVNPTMDEMPNNDLDLIVASSEQAIVMVEGGANEASESEIIDALMLAYESAQPIIKAQKEMVAKIGKNKRAGLPSAITPEFSKLVADKVTPGLRQALAINDKIGRYSAVAVTVDSCFKELVVANLITADQKGLYKGVVEHVKEKIIREGICQGRRVDGRDLKTIRPIDVQVGMLPCTHGSALFTRGETRALVVSTLGTADDEQRIELLSGESVKKFMMHYNFPPYSVGEVKPLRSPGRREIGHGALAERSIARVLPKHEEFPYTLRVVSDIMESNGSSSMATVCGASLSLMDAGVPIRAAVAGVAMGLVVEDNRHHVISDILGDEDHVGDMDFKVAGTRHGITGLQMDIKIAGVTRAILSEALEQARLGRLHVLEKMANVLEQPRHDINALAPRIKTLEVNPDKLGAIIGPSGKMIRSITERTGTKIDIEDSGKVHVASANLEKLQEAVRIIEAICEEPVVGKIYKGTVKRIVEFGAFVEILPGKDGLVHVSQLDTERVENVRDVLKEGDIIDVKIVDIDRDRKIRLSRKAVITGEDGLDEIPDRGPRRERGRGGARRR